MNCEICHSADAETAIRKEVDGEARELFVCRKCAAHEALSSNHDAEILVEILFGAITEAFDPPGRAQAHGGGMTTPCPACGMGHDEYRRRSRLGCAECYRHFARELEPLLRDMHQGRRHLGKAPAAFRATVARARLEEALAEAVAHQQFEKAAALRDQIGALAPTPEPQPRKPHA